MYPVTALITFEVVFANFFLRGEFSFFMAFTWSTVVVTCLANSYTSSDETKLLLSSTMNFKISFFLHSCAIFWCGIYTIKYRAVWVTETALPCHQIFCFRAFQQSHKRGHCIKPELLQARQVPIHLYGFLDSTAFSTRSSFRQYIWSQWGISTFPIHFLRSSLGIVKGMVTEKASSKRPS